MSKVELLPSTITTDGVYTLNNSSVGYATIDVLFGQRFDDVKDSYDFTSDIPSLIPPLTSSDDQGYVLTASSIYSHAVRQPHMSFMGVTAYSKGDGWGCDTGDSSGAWIQVNNTNGKFKTDMFTIYNGSPISIPNFAINNLQILGSNDGDNWDILVDDKTHLPNMVTRTYTLDGYVEYSYIRFLSVSAVSSRVCFTCIFIQDTALHKYVGSKAEMPMVKEDDAYSLSHEGSEIQLSGDQLMVTDLSSPIASISATELPVVPRIYKLYKKGDDGTPTLIMAEPSKIGSSLETDNLYTDLSSLASKQYVADTIDNLSRSSLDGKVDTYDELPTTDVRVGTMYLVGTEGALEEYIFTEDGTWERMGEIRPSDVNLSGYTNTEGLTAALVESSATMDGNITSMRDDITDTLATLNDSAQAELGELPLDCQFNTGIPTTWDNDISASGVLFVIEPDTISYTAPELRTGNGTPFVDEYAVSIVGTDYGREAYLATYDSTGSREDSVMHLNDSLHMTFKDPLQPGNIDIGNRYYIVTTGTYGYHITDFKVEAKTDSGDWITVIAATNPSSGWGVISKIPIQCDGFYREFRFTPLDCIPGAGGKIPYFNLVRLSGLIKKS